MENRRHSNRKKTNLQSAIFCFCICIGLNLNLINVLHHVVKREPMTVHMVDLNTFTNYTKHTCYTIDELFTNSKYYSSCLYLYTVMHICIVDSVCVSVCAKHNQHVNESSDERKGICRSICLVTASFSLYLVHV